MSFHFKIGAITDVGKVRAINEDSFAVERDLGLFIVADGVGGWSGGEIASKMAIEILKNHVHAEQEPLQGEYRPEFSQQTNRMLSGLQLANAAIYEVGQRPSDHRRMATTLSSVYIHGDVMTLAYIGDSPIYRMRGERLQRLTMEHALVAEQLRYGLITAEEAAASPSKHVLTRALGAEETVLIEADEEVLLDRDRILLCTDGLTNMVGEEEMARIILGTVDNPQKACEALVAAANDRGGTDNMAVILVYCEKDTPRIGLLERAVLSIIDGLRNVYGSFPGCLKPEKAATRLRLGDAKWQAAL